MTKAEIHILRNDFAAQLAEIRALKQLISDLLPKLSEAVASADTRVKAIVDDLRADI